LWSSFCQGIGLAAVFRGSPLFDAEVVRLRVPPAAQAVDIVSGCVLLIRRAIWDALGGFDPAFFMYGEDFDLSLRADAMGAQRWITPDARVIHHGGASESDNADRLVRLLRSKAQLFDRHFSQLGAQLAKRTLWLWALTRMLGYGAAARIGGRARASSEAWREVWRRRAAFLEVPPPDARPGARPR
jgi:GT2 family glycosyltransferase